MTRDELEASLLEAIKEEDAPFGDHEVWPLVLEEFYDKTRWSIIYRYVFKHVPTGRFFAACIARPATEYQECDSTPDIEEVEAVEVTTVEYRALPKKQGERKVAWPPPAPKVTE